MQFAGHDKVIYKGIGCEQVFEAAHERRDGKRFCSTRCQEYETSARQNRKRKIRAACEEECSTEVENLLHVLDDPKITQVMVDAILAESKS